MPFSDFLKNMQFFVPLTFRVECSYSKYTVTRAREIGQLRLEILARRGFRVDPENYKGELNDSRAIRTIVHSNSEGDREDSSLDRLTSGLGGLSI
jgi:hypothetical protein